MGTLVIRVSGDHMNGSPEFTVTVDGEQIGGVMSTTAIYGRSEWQEITINGDFDATSAHTINVYFNNDAFGSGGDRNLYIESLSIDGVRFEAEIAAYLQGTNGVLWDSAAMWANGTLQFNLTGRQTQSSSGLHLLGVNFSGAEEYGELNLADRPGVDYFYPTHSEIDYIAQKGFNVIRLPFQWERLQPTQNGSLSPTELTYIDDVVAYANARGLKVILDVHNFGSGYGHLLGSDGTPVGSFADLWGKLANHFKSNDQVLFGLMNEPQLGAADWIVAANAAISAIRSAGANSQTVLVSGSYWGTTFGWITSDNPSVIGGGVVDPANNYMFEVHQYFNADGSGVYGDTVSETIGVDRMRAITEWARITGSKLFLGEFGINSDSLATSAMDQMLAFMSQNSDVWAGGAYWQAGSTHSYYFTISPQNGVDTPQMNILEKYVPMNSMPVVSAGIEDANITGGTTWSYTVPIGTFTDPEGRTLVLSAALSNGAALPSWLTFDATTRSFSGTPPEDFANALDLKVMASDGGLSASDIFRLTVTPANKAPVAQDDQAEVAEDALVIGQLLSNDTDVDSSVLEVTGVNGSAVGVSGTIIIGAFGTLTIKSDGSYSYKADRANDLILGETGIDRLTYRVSDGRLEDVGLVAFSVSGSDEVLIGTSASDTLTGGRGADKLNGGAGNDYLKGGTGRDTFIFDTKLSSSNVDRIADYNVADDTIYLDNAVFTKLGSGSLSSPTRLSSSYLTVSSAAKDANDYLVYNHKTGYLYYDADGFGRGKMVLVAALPKNLAITYSDFYVT